VAAVSFDAVSKEFPDGTRAVDALGLEIRDGEFMVLVGPSGCGKTTSLRMLAGLEDVSSGEIRIDGRVINDVEPSQRDIAMVFQNYALFPHLNVFDNIAFGLRARRAPKHEIRERVTTVARALELADLLKRKPGALSGGQRQRVAMGRAIVRNPSVMLMDEPLSNLDAKLRVQMRAEISRTHLEVGATTVYVTHDQVEAMTMGDRIAVLRAGILQQVDDPETLYERPANLFVASFVGSPAMNLLEGRIIGRECRIGDQLVQLSDATLTTHPGLVAADGGVVAVGIRPEHFSLGDSDAQTALPGRVLTTEMLGAEIVLHVEVDAVPVRTAETIEVASDIDAVAATGLDRTRAQIVVRLPAQRRPPVGSLVSVVVDTTRLHFFDLETGRTLATNGVAAAA
jgi:multiple sugar transport system ATP-binding protein